MEIIKKNRSWLVVLGISLLFGVDTFLAAAKKKKKKKGEVEVLLISEEVFGKLCVAARVCDKEALDALLAQEMSINAVDTKGRTALHYMVLENNVEAVQFLLKAKADGNVQDKWGRTSLHDASSRGYEEVVCCLLEPRAEAEAPVIDINRLDNKSYSALHCAVLIDDFDDRVKEWPQDKPYPSIDAVEEGRVNVVKVLVGHNADINIRDKHGLTPLHCAVLNNDPVMVRSLIHLGADVEAMTNEGRTIFDCVAMFSQLRNLNSVFVQQQAINDQQMFNYNRHSKVINELLKIKYFCVNCYKVKKEHEKFCACGGFCGATYCSKECTTKDWKKGHSFVCRPLTKNDGIVKTLSDIARAFDKEALDVFLAQGVSIDEVDTTGRTALSYMAFGNNVKEVQFLLNAKANGNIQDDHGKNSLDYALSEGHEKVVRCLLTPRIDAEASTIDINKLNNYGYAPLHVVAYGNYLRKKVEKWPEDKPFPSIDILEEKYVKMTKLLVNGNANVNVLDSHGATPLHWAAKEGHPAMVSCLIELGAEVDAVDKKGYTSLAWAKESEYAPDVRINDVRTNDVRTNKEWAFDNSRHEQVISRLLDTKYFCFNCHKMKEKNQQLSSCGKCYEAVYCSRNCQIEHWKKGHSGFCLLSILLKKNKLEKSVLEGEKRELPSQEEKQQQPEEKQEQQVESQQERELSSKEKRQEQQRQKGKEQKSLDQTKEEERDQALNEERKKQAEKELQKQQREMADKQARIDQEKEVATALHKKREEESKLLRIAIKEAVANGDPTNIRNLVNNRRYELYGSDVTVRRVRQLRELLGHSAIKERPAKPEKATKAAAVQGASKAVGKNEENKTKKKNGSAQEKNGAVGQKHRSGATQNSRLRREERSEKYSARLHELPELSASFSRQERIAFFDALKRAEAREEETKERSAEGAAAVVESEDRAEDKQTHVLLEKNDWEEIQFDYGHVFEGDDSGESGIHLDPDKKLLKSGQFVWVKSALSRMRNGCYKAKKTGQDDSQARSFFPAQWKPEDLLKRLQHALGEKDTFVYEEYSNGRVGDTIICGIVPKCAGDLGQVVTGTIYFKAIIKRGKKGVVRTAYPITFEDYKEECVKASYVQRVSADQETPVKEKAAPEKTEKGARARGESEPVDGDHVAAVGAEATVGGEAGEVQGNNGDDEVKLSDEQFYMENVQQLFLTGNEWAQSYSERKLQKENGAENDVD